MFEYLADEVNIDQELQSFLNSYGAEGWRLHTCEPIRSGYVLIVMDRLIDTGQEKQRSMGESDGIRVG